MPRIREPVSASMILLQGPPAVILKAVVRGLLEEIETGVFPAKLDDWECALADALTKKLRKHQPPWRYLPQARTTWRGKVFEG